MSFVGKIIDTLFKMRMIILTYDVFIFEITFLIPNLADVTFTHAYFAGEILLLGISNGSGSLIRVAYSKYFSQIFLLS